MIDRDGLFKQLIVAGASLITLYSLCSAGTDIHQGEIVNMRERYNGKIVLIVNGDDVGVTPIFTDATLQAYLKGGISSASIIATGHDIDRAISLFRKHPDLSVGVHLTLTGDWEPLTGGKSLRDTNGLMFPTAEEAGRWVVPAEAEYEWDAQINKITGAGLKVSHLDSHMGCYFQTRELFNAALRLAKKYTIPLIAPPLPDWIPASDLKLFECTSYSGIYRLENTAETAENRAAAYWKKFAGLTPGIHYLFTHQGFEPADKQISGDLDLRINETRFWVNETTKKNLAARGIVISGCNDLKVDFQRALETGQ